MRAIRLGLAVLMLSTVANAQDDESLVGTPCPEFALSQPVQGAPWQKGDLVGSIVVLDLFQIG